MPTRRGAVDYYLDVRTGEACALRELGVRIDPRRPVAGPGPRRPSRRSKSRGRVRSAALLHHLRRTVGDARQQGNRARARNRSSTWRGSGVWSTSATGSRRAPHRRRRRVLARRMQGCAVGETKNLDRDQMIRAMVGRELARRDVDPPAHGDDVVLRGARAELSRCSRTSTSTCGAARSSGWSGLVGAGRTEIGQGARRRRRVHHG